MVIKVQKFL